MDGPTAGDWDGGQPWKVPGCSTIAGRVDAVQPEARSPERSRDKENGGGPRWFRDPFGIGRRQEYGGRLARASRTGVLGFRPGKAEHLAQQNDDRTGVKSRSQVGRQQRPAHLVHGIEGGLRWEEIGEMQTVEMTLSEMRNETPTQEENKVGLNGMSGTLGRVCERLRKPRPQLVEGNREFQRKFE